MNTSQKRISVFAILATVFSLIGCLQHIAQYRIDSYDFVYVTFGISGLGILHILLTLLPCILLLLCCFEKIGSDHRRTAFWIGFGTIALRIVLALIKGNIVNSLMLLVWLVCFTMAAWLINKKAVELMRVNFTPVGRGFAAMGGIALLYRYIRIITNGFALAGSRAQIITMIWASGEFLGSLALCISVMLFAPKGNAAQDGTAAAQDGSYFTGCDENASNKSNIGGRTNMAQPIYVLEGFRGSLRVFEDRVEISKAGGFLIGGKSSKMLPMANINSVSLNPATVTARGFIEFTVPGGKDSKTVTEALTNENAVVLKMGQNEEAAQIKGYIEEQILKRANAQGGTTVVQQAASPAEELKKFKELLDMGIITQEEFDAKKRQLLGL